MFLFGKGAMLRRQKTIITKALTTKYVTFSLYLSRITLRKHISHLIN